MLSEVKAPKKYAPPSPSIILAGDLLYFKKPRQLKNITKEIIVSRGLLFNKDIKENVKE